MKLKLFFALISLLMLGCGNNLTTQVLNNIDRSISNSDQYVRFDDLNLEYDSILILPPYSVVDKIESDINLNLNLIKKTGINLRDDISVIVFLKNRIVIDFVEIKSYKADFTYLKPDKIYPKNKSFFIKLKNEPNLTRRIILEES